MKKTHRASFLSWQYLWADTVALNARYLLSVYSHVCVCYTLWHSMLPFKSPERYPINAAHRFYQTWRQKRADSPYLPQKQQHSLSRAGQVHWPTVKVISNQNVNFHLWNLQSASWVKVNLEHCISAVSRSPSQKFDHIKCYLKCQTPGESHRFADLSNQ